MDLRIRNPYINKFLHGFSNQNELKLIKYLTILGIHSLETEKKRDITFSDLKNRAKNISKNCAKEDKLINKELHIIKNELVKLSQKFEQSLQDDLHDPGTTLSSSNPHNKALDQKNATRKPLSKGKGDKNSTSQEFEKKRQQKTARASSIEPTVKYDWQITQRKASNQIDGVTMKPTEIAFAAVDYKQKRSVVTRHHLDDTEAKRLMTDEGMISSNKDRPNRHRNARTQGVGRSASHNRIPEEAAEESNARYRSVTRQKEKGDEYESSNSPGKQNAVSMKKHQGGSELDDTKRSNQVKAKKSREVGKKVAKQPTKEEQKSSAKVRQKILREKAKYVGRNNLTQASRTGERLPTEYSNVESKIKNEVNYHKELSKQYQKMRQSIQEYTEPDDKFSDASSPNDNHHHHHHVPDNKFVFVSKPQRSERMKQPSSQREYPSQTSNLETPSSSQISHPYRKYSPHQESERNDGYSMSASRSKRSEIKRNNDNLDYSKHSASRGFGMLDIANSFLNSPFMRHLSNIDGKNSESSSSSSINPSASVSVRGNTYGRYDAFEETPVNLEKAAREDDQRFKAIQRTYSKYSEWETSGKGRAGGKENSYMNESNNRYNEFNGKESGNYYANRNEGGSFASSHFSNFLNDEMKGFFQKETLDLERPRHPKSMVRSSGNSSRISFNANELTSNVKGANVNPKKRGDVKRQDKYNNKSCLEELAETPNVFREDRMSMSHLLNTS